MGTLKPSTEHIPKQHERYANTFWCLAADRQWYMAGVRTESVVETSNEAMDLTHPVQRHPGAQINAVVVAKKTGSTRR